MVCSAVVGPIGSTAFPLAERSRVSADGGMLTPPLSTLQVGGSRWVPGDVDKWKTG